MEKPAHTSGHIGHLHQEGEILRLHLAKSRFTKWLYTADVRCSMLVIVVFVVCYSYIMLYGIPIFSPNIHDVSIKSYCEWLRTPAPVGRWFIPL